MIVLDSACASVCLLHWVFCAVWVVCWEPAACPWRRGGYKAGVTRGGKGGGVHRGGGVKGGKEGGGGGERQLLVADRHTVSFLAAKAGHTIRQVTLTATGK